MKHSSLVIWISLSVVFLGLFTTFISLLAAQRKKAAANPTPPGPAVPGSGPLQRPERERPS